MFLAFPISRGYFKHSNALYAFFVFSGFLPAGLIPLFIEAQKLGLYNSRFGYLVINSLAGAGFFFFVGYIKTIPREIDEAAAMDGCGYVRFIFTMIIPQMKPALATFGVFGFVAAWNNLILPLVMLSDPGLWPVTRGLFAFFGQYSSQWPVVAAATVIVAIPILIVFVILQRQLVEGVAGGAAAGTQGVTAQTDLEQLHMTEQQKRALVVRGGWDGHVPIPASDRYAAVLKDDGYAVAVSDTLDSYLDDELLAATDLIVQCWTMGQITGDQAVGLTNAVRAGTGFAGWHGGIIDSFRSETRYQLMTGGQFVHHPREFSTYQVRPLPPGASGDGRDHAVHRHYRAVLPAHGPGGRGPRRHRLRGRPGSIPNSRGSSCPSRGPVVGARAGSSSPRSDTTSPTSKCPRRTRY